MRNQTTDYKNAQRERKKIRWKRARALGLCSRCCKQPSAPEKAQCQDCLDYQVEMRSNLREVVYMAYGNKCSCPPCGENRWQFLTLDHINNDGYKYRNNIGHNLISWAHQNSCPTTLRLLCANCNTGRARNKGVCPHLSLNRV